MTDQENRFLDKQHEDYINKHLFYGQAKAFADACKRCGIVFLIELRKIVKDVKKCIKGLSHDRSK